MEQKKDTPKAKVIKFSARREKLAQILATNPKKTMRQAMLEVGYSNSSSLTGGSGIVKSKGFQLAMEKYLPDELLLKKHLEFLNSKRLVKEFRKGDLTNEISETDPSAVRALDLAYKIKGRYIVAGPTQNNLIIQVSDKSASRFGVPDSIHAEVRETLTREVEVETVKPEDEPHSTNPTRTKKGYFKKGVDQKHVYHIDASSGTDSD